MADDRHDGEAGSPKPPQPASDADRARQLPDIDPSQLNSLKGLTPAQQLQVVRTAIAQMQAKKAIERAKGKGTG